MIFFCYHGTIREWSQWDHSQIMLFIVEYHRPDYRPDFPHLDYQ